MTDWITEHNKKERIESIISGKRSECNNANCDMCHGLGYVAKITYPITLYYKTGKGNERKLMPKYKEIWICDDCGLKLIEILKGCGA